MRGRAKLKKLFFTVGAFLIILGFILAVNYNVTKNMRKIEIVGQKYNTCEITVYLNKGDKFRVICSPAANWGEELGEWDKDDVIPYNHRHVWFEIVDPNGAITEFNTAWTRYSPTNQPLDIPLSRCFVNVTVLGEGLEVEGRYPTYIGGIAKISGNYTVRIPLDEYGYPFIYPPPLSDPDPPAYLAIEKEYPVETRPYMFLLPVGASLSGIGIVISIWSTKKPKKRKR